MDAQLWRIVGQVKNFARPTFKGLRQRRGSCWEKGNRKVFPQQGVIDLLSITNQRFFTKSQQNGIELVVRPGTSNTPTDQTYQGVSTIVACHQWATGVTLLTKNFQGQARG